MFEMYGFNDSPRYQNPLIPPIHQMNNDFVVQCLRFKPDVLLVFKGDTIFKDSLTIIKRKIRPLMATWWVDDPFMHWDGGGNIRPFTNTLASLYLWDYFFIYETYTLQRLKRIGVKNPYYLPNATDTDYFHTLRKNDAKDKYYYGADISFIGTPDRLRAEMIRALNNQQIKLWGPPWRDSYYQEKHVKSNLNAKEVCKVYHYTKINLNRHFMVNVTGANVRTFDIPACEGFLLTDDMADITNILYEKDREVVTYKNMRDLQNKVKYFLKHDRERKDIAKNARKKTIAKHLYKHRVKELLEIINQ